MNEKPFKKGDFLRLSFNELRKKRPDDTAWNLPDVHCSALTSVEDGELLICFTCDPQSQSYVRIGLLNLISRKCNRE